MDKRTLQLFSMLLIPGFLMLYTLFSPTFLNTTDLVFTIPVRVIFTIFCLVIGGLSLTGILTKSYSTVDSIKDSRDRIKIDNITNIIDKYLENEVPDFHKSSNKEDIKKWVTEHIKE